jgi:hypothetical protein
MDMGIVGALAIYLAVTLTGVYLLTPDYGRLPKED